MNELKLKFALKGYSKELVEVITNCKLGKLLLNKNQEPVIVESLPCDKKQDS